MPVLICVRPPGAAAYIKSTCTLWGSPKSCVVAICSQSNAKADVSNARWQTGGRIDGGSKRWAVGMVTVGLLTGGPSRRNDICDSIFKKTCS